MLTLTACVCILSMLCEMRLFIHSYTTKRYTFNVHNKLVDNRVLKLFIRYINSLVNCTRCVVILSVFIDKWYDLSPFFSCLIQSSYSSSKGLVVFTRFYDCWYFDLFFLLLSSFALLALVFPSFLLQLNSCGMHLLVIYEVTCAMTCHTCQDTLYKHVSSQ